MSTFGGTGLDQLFSDGYRGVADSVPELALFKMLDQLPFTKFVSAVSVLLIAIFFVTSADSGSLVMDTITAGGKWTHPCSNNGSVKLPRAYVDGKLGPQQISTKPGREQASHGSSLPPRSHG